MAADRSPDATSGKPDRGRTSSKPLDGRFVAFDIETAKILPEKVTDLLAHRPLGISCAALLKDGDEEPRLWYSTDADGRPADQMTKQNVRDLVSFIQQLVSDGARLVTWNGLGFDFDILAEESGLHQECKVLALDHTDMMFHVFCEQGYPVSLDAASKALGLSGKPVNVQAEHAPSLWAKGQYDDVLEYVANDCRLTLHVAKQCSKLRRFQWITRRGKQQSFTLPNGWLPVSEAVNLPQPDTSWMDHPWPRSRFLKWTQI